MARNETPARQVADWIQSAMLYQVWPRSLTTAGTLQGVTSRLADIAELGATVVYLTPINMMSSDPRDEYLSPRTRQSKEWHFRNPYRIASYDLIEPEFGTEADLIELVEQAHALGLRVLMDLVYLHMGPDCDLLRNPEYYIAEDDGSPKLSQWNFPLLNFASPALREYLIGNMRHWVQDVGVDGFRCDVSGAVPLDFWEQARDAMDELRPDLFMIAEADKASEQVKAFDASYSFGFYRVLKSVGADGEPASELKRKWLADRDEFPAGARRLRYSDNHDLDRVDIVFSARGALATAVLNFTLDGVPMLYNGQEIGDGTPNEILSSATIRWDTADFAAVAPRRAFYQSLFALRAAERCLTHGDLAWLDVDRPESVVAFIRTLGEERIVSVINFSNRKLTVRVTGLPTTGVGQVLIGGDWEGGAAFELESFGLRVVKYGGAA